MMLNEYIIINCINIPTSLVGMYCNILTLKRSSIKLTKMLEGNPLTLRQLA